MNGPAAAPPVLCFGEIVWDLFPDRRSLGGAPLNVSVHLNRLGRPALPVSAVGDDDLGREAVRAIAARNTATDLVTVRPGTPTGTVTVLPDGAGGHAFIISPVAAWDEIPTSPALLALAGRAPAIIYGSLAGRSCANRRLLDDLLATTGGLRVYDVNLRPPFFDPAVIAGVAARSDLIKLNDEELGLLAGLDPGTLRAEGVEQEARRLADRHQVGRICVTCGGRGAGLLSDGRWLFEPSRPAPVVDTVGAGDAFLARLLHGALMAEPESAYLAAACRMAEWVVSQPGAIPDAPLPSGIGEHHLV